MPELEDITQSVTEVFKAGAPLIYCDTTDDQRVSELAIDVAAQSNAILLQWRSTMGLRMAIHSQPEKVLANAQQVGTFEALLAWLWAEHQQQDPAKRQLPRDRAALLLAMDAVHEEPCPAGVIRYLKDLYHFWEPHSSATRRTLLLTGTSFTPPPALAGYLFTTHLPLPSRQEIIANVIDPATGAQAPGLLRHRIKPAEFAERARGLSWPAITLLLRRLEVLSERSDPIALLDEVKKEEVRRTQILEIISPERDKKIELGGFHNFKTWFQARRGFFTQSSRPKLKPRGVMLLGFPGCGKSHAARFIAQEMQVPMVSMDLGRVQDRWVGSSEARMRLALQTLEAAAPVVLFIDEIEKALAGTGSDGSGVTTRLVGQLLSWLSDRTVAVFVVATCNDDSKLPKELMRAGRFDATFIVKPPSFQERREILAAVAKDLDLDISSVLEYIVSETGPDRAGYTGAELRQLLTEAAYVAGPENILIRKEHIDRAKTSVSPLVFRQDGAALLSRYQDERAQGYLPAGVPL